MRTVIGRHGRYYCYYACRRGLVYCSRPLRPRVSRARRKPKVITEVHSVRACSVIISVLPPTTTTMKITQRHWREGIIFAMCFPIRFTVRAYNMSALRSALQHVDTASTVFLSFFFFDQKKIYNLLFGFYNRLKRREYRVGGGGSIDNCSFIDHVLLSLHRLRSVSARVVGFYF